MIMKLCTKCLLEKSIHEFSWKYKSKQRRQSWCKDCFKVVDKDRYYNGSRKKQVLALNKKYKKERKRIVGEYKVAKGCLVCSYNRCADALDFHHPNDDKESTVSSLVTNLRSMEKVWREIEKCEVLCCRCHRELHSSTSL